MSASRVCSNCGRELYARHPYIRCCDADVCSDACAKARMKLIAAVDPQFTSPMSWPGTQPFGTCAKAPMPVGLPQEKHMKRSASVGLLQIRHQYNPIIAYPSDDDDDPPPSPVDPPRSKRLLMYLAGCLALVMVSIIFA